jgi:hypothetical protein
MDGRAGRSEANRLAMDRSSTSKNDEVASPSRGLPNARSWMAGPDDPNPNRFATDGNGTKSKTSGVASPPRGLPNASHALPPS